MSGARALSFTALALFAASACRQPPPPTGRAESAGKIHGLEAEVALLRSRLDPQHAPVSLMPAVNVHEHLLGLEHLERYLPAARALHVKKTVIVASPKFTLYGKGEKGEPGMAQNFAAVLDAAKRYPDEIVPFFTLAPDDPDVLDRAKAHVAAGGKGVKLYSGHSNLHESVALDDERLMPVYAYLEEQGLPVNWHINLVKWTDEFDRVMARHPKLNVMLPHFGVAFWNPERHMPILMGLMDKYPSIYVDTSLGTREILIDGLYKMAEHKELFRAFFEKYQDRILYGSDAVITGNKEKTTSWFFKVLLATRDQLELPLFHFDLAEGYSRYHEKQRDPTGDIPGLDIDEAILKKIYWDNAERWLAGPAEQWSKPRPFPVVEAAAVTPPAPAPAPAASPDGGAP